MSRDAAVVALHSIARLEGQVPSADADAGAAAAPLGLHWLPAIWQKSRNGISALPPYRSLFWAHRPHLSVSTWGLSCPEPACISKTLRVW